jgi:hypothetical protein
MSLVACEHALLGGFFICNYGRYLQQIQPKWKQNSIVVAMLDVWATKKFVGIPKKQPIKTEVT